MRAARSRTWMSALSGVVAAAAGLGAGGLAAVVIAPADSPLLVVGAMVIDLVPGWVKDAVVAVFGTGDKAFLLVVLGVLTASLAAVSGVLESRRPPFGRIVVAAAGLTGAIAAITRSSSSPLGVVPSLVAMAIAAIVLHAFVTRLPRSADDADDGTPSAAAASAPPPHPAPSSSRHPFSRRGFLVWSAALTAAGVFAALGGRALSAGADAVTAIRQALRLPRAAVSAPPVPRGASFPVEAITPIVTSNDDFYRIDTALQVPQIDPRSWSLELTGMVRNTIRLTWDELLHLPLEESYTTLACVSNTVGGDLIGNAKWLGYPIRRLLARAQPLADADCVLSTSQDGWTATTPLSALTDGRNAILAIGMNDQPLPFDHGFPVRMVVPGLYGYVSATKWVVKLEVTQFSRVSSYWSERGWAVRGPVKLESRIDVPQDGTTVQGGDLVVAGVAWHQHVGVSAVQVKVDDGPWNPATLAAAIGIDTWRQWRWEWKSPARGNHRLTVRAVDAAGDVQTSVIAEPAPNGASGYDQIDVTVA